MTRRDRRTPNRHATRRGPTPRVHRDSVEDQPLIRQIRQALRSDDPTAVAATGSSMLAGADALVQRTLIDSFIDVDIAETTAMLHVFAALLDDELEVARIRATLRARRHPLPDSVTAIGTWQVTEALVASVAPLEGEHVVLGVTGDGLPAAVFMIYIDHRPGSAVRDGFLSPILFPEMVERMTEMSEEQGEHLVRDQVSTADARAILEDALAFPHPVEPVDEAVSWPGVRPLLEMLLKTMPPGGEGIFGGEPLDLDVDFGDEDEGDEGFRL